MTHAPMTEEVTMPDPAVAAPADDAIPAPEAQAPAAPPRKTFSAWLLEQRNGGLHADLTDALADVTAAVAEQEKRGTVTLTISIAPGGAAGTVLVTDDVKAKPPVAPPVPVMFFADGYGNLSRRDPNQPELPFRQVAAAPAAPARVVDPGTGEVREVPS